MGGIGCGKSSVTALLAAHGAAVVDADVIAREVVTPGSPALARLVASFGDEIVPPGGELDRSALATRAFADPGSTMRMNEILHPAIGVELVRQVRAARERARVVVVAIPLFRPEHRAQLGIDTVVCVDCREELAASRLVTERGMDPEDVALRMASQPTRAERRAIADEVVENDGTFDELAKAVAALWARLEVA